MSNRKSKYPLLDAASYKEIVEWVDTTWKVVATDELILRGFKQCGYIDCSGNTQLHSKLRATIESRNVPMAIIEEVNVFMEEMNSFDREEVINEDDSSDENESEYEMEPEVDQEANEDYEDQDFCLLHFQKILNVRFEAHAPLFGVIGYVYKGVSVWIL